MNTKLIGILGSGQLSRMLVEAASSLELLVRVLAGSASDPACLVGAPFVVGPYQDTDVLIEFLKSISTIIFENEFIDCNVLRKSSFTPTFCPALEVIEQVQNKLTQKKIFQKLKIKSANFIVYESNGTVHEQKTNRVGLSQWLEEALALFPRGVVLKWARNGYDGKGNFFLKSLDQKETAIVFCEEAVKQNIQIYAEEMISFKRELAMIAVKSISGEFISYPLVISEQVQGICKRVYGPAQKFGVAASLEGEARTVMSKIAESLNITGTFAVEFFETVAGELFVNEMAPRVHNSGHYTMAFEKVSQFENHLRAAQGKPLHHFNSEKLFLMINLLGPSSIRRKVELAGPAEPVPAGCRLHWYQKQEVRSGRKMGHINGVFETKKALEEAIAQIDLWEQRWYTSLSTLGDSNSGA